MSTTPPPTSPPSAPLIDQSTLNDSEKALLEAFERRGTGSLSVHVDDPSLVSAEDLEETDTPGSDGSDAATGAPTTVEGPSGAPVSAPSTPVVESPVTPADASVEGEEPGGIETPAPVTPAFTFAGVDYDAEQLSHAVRLQGWYNRLNNDQLQAIDALLSNQYVLVPATASVAPQTPPQQTQPQATVPVSPSPTVDDGAGEWLDPRAEAEIAALRNQLTQMQQSFQQNLAPLVQTQANTQLQQNIAAIERAESAFRANYTLDDTIFKTIQDSVIQAGILPSLLPQHNGNVEAATRQAYEMMFWTTPAFREAHLGARASSDLAEAAQADQAEVDRKKKLTALSPSSGGSVPRPSTRTPQTKDDRHAGMVELIRADMNGQ